MRKKTHQNNIKFFQIRQQLRFPFFGPLSCQALIFSFQQPEREPGVPKPFPGCQKGAPEVAKVLPPPNGNHGAGYPQPRQLLGHFCPKPAASRARSRLNGWRHWASRLWKPRLPESLPSSLPAARQRASASAQASRILPSALLSDFSWRECLSFLLGCCMCGPTLHFLAAPACGHGSQFVGMWPQHILCHTWHLFPLPFQSQI